MRRIIFAAAAVFLVLAAPVMGQTETTPYIEMSATVLREVTPDEIYLQITINENDYKGKKSLEEMQSAMIGALKANRIDVPESLTLNYMGSDVSYTMFSKSIKPKTEASYTLKLHDVITMQKVIASLEERQISNITLVKIRYSRENELRSEMGIEAMKQAQAEARELAGAIGQEIGKAISISSWMNGGDGIQPRIYKSRVNMPDDMALTEGNGEEFGISKLTYRFNANVKFELK